jgi:hypothetical protein
MGITPLGTDVTGFMAWSNRTYTPTLLVNLPLNVICSLPLAGRL